MKKILLLISYLFVNLAVSAQAMTDHAQMVKVDLDLYSRNNFPIELRKLEIEIGKSIYHIPDIAMDELAMLTEFHGIEDGVTFTSIYPTLILEKDLDYINAFKVVLIVGIKDERVIEARLLFGELGQSPSLDLNVYPLKL